MGPRQARHPRGLAKACHTSADTVYKWFSGETPPNTDALQALADALGVRRFEIVAAMDGEETVMPLNETTRAAFVSLMDEWADQRGLPGHRPARSTETRAAS